MNNRCLNKRTHECWSILAEQIGVNDSEECIDLFDTEREAIHMVAKYQMAFGNNWRIWYQSGDHSG